MFSKQKLQIQKGKFRVEIIDMSKFKLGTLEKHSGTIGPRQESNVRLCDAMQLQIFGHTNMATLIVYA